jgi:hypothetical protein
MHAVGGASGSTTMVMVFDMLFVLFVWSYLVLINHRMQMRIT